MQLDRTRIAIRERGVLDIFDLALQVVRVFFWPLATAWLVAVIPLMLLNWWLIGWMVEHANVDPEPWEIIRYIFHYMLLVFAESPLLSIPIAGFLGPAVFMERPTLRQILRNALQFTPHLLFCLLILRGIGPILLFCGTRGEVLSEEGGVLEALALMVLFGYTAIFHALRPFTTEIILLERTPFFPKDERTISLFRRSGFLHGPAAQNLIGQWMAGAVLGVFLAISLLIAVYVLVGVLVNEWGGPNGPGTLHYWWIFPVPLFLVSGFLSVVRFLNYLDARIRNEGWEVELLLVAEAGRLQSRITV